MACFRSNYNHRLARTEDMRVGFKTVKQVQLLIIFMKQIEVPKYCMYV